MDLSTAIYMLKNHIKSILKPFPKTEKLFYLIDIKEINEFINNIKCYEMFCNFEMDDKIKGKIKNISNNCNIKINNCDYVDLLNSINEYNDLNKCIENEIFLKLCKIKIIYNNIDKNNIYTLFDIQNNYEEIKNLIILNNYVICSNFFYTDTNFTVSMICDNFGFSSHLPLEILEIYKKINLIDDNDKINCYVALINK